MHQEAPHIPCTSGERIRRPLTSPGLMGNASGTDLHTQGVLGKVKIPWILKTNQCSFGYINPKISKWYISLRCPMLSKALEQYLTDRNE